MALTTKNQLLIAYKKLVGKAHTNSQFGDVNEDIGSNIQIDFGTIFSEQIPNNPVGSSIVELVEFVTEEIPLSQYTANGSILGTISDDGDGAPTLGSFSNGYHAFKLKLPSNYQTTSTNSKKGTGFFLNNQVLADTTGTLQIVPSRYGVDYIPEVFSGSTTIYALDEENYYLDTYNGILFVQDINRKPTKVSAYLYIGNYLNDVLQNISGSTGSAAGPEQSIQFNSGSTLSGTSNLIYDYNTNILSGITAEFTTISASSISASNYYGINLDLTKTIVNSDISLATTQRAIFAKNTPSSSITITLPNAALADSREYYVIKADSIPGSVMISGSGSDLINGSGSFELNGPYQSVTLITDGTDWYIF